MLKGKILLGYTNLFSINKHEIYLFIKETGQKKLMINKHKKVCTTLHFSEHFVVLASIVARCVPVSVFTSLLGISIGIKSSATELTICAITAAIKTYRSLIKKKKMKHDKIVILAKPKLNITEMLISKALINSNISHDEFILVNVLKNMIILKKKSKILMINKYASYTKKVLISKKKFSNTYYEIFKKVMSYIENNLIDSKYNMYLTSDSLTEINSILAGSNNITLKEVNAKRYGFDKMYLY